MFVLCLASHLSCSNAKSICLRLAMKGNVHVVLAPSISALIGHLYRQPVNYEHIERSSVPKHRYKDLEKKLLHVFRSRLKKQLQLGLIMIEQVALLGSSVINFFGRKLSTSTTTEQQKFKTNTTENLHREHSNPPSSETAMRSSWLCAFFISCVIIVLLGLALFVACMASEIRRAKV